MPQLAARNRFKPTRLAAKEKINDKGKCNIGGPLKHLDDGAELCPRPTFLTHLICLEEEEKEADGRRDFPICPLSYNKTRFSGKTNIGCDARRGFRLHLFFETIGQNKHQR